MHLWLHWVEWSGGLRTRHSSSPSIGDKTLDEVPEARIVFEEAPAWLFQYDTGIQTAIIINNIVLRCKGDWVDQW